MGDKEEREQLQARLKHYREANKRSYMDLIRMGAELPPDVLILIRLDALLDLLLTKDQRDMFELEFEKRLAHAIEDAKRERVTDALTKPLKVGGMKLPE